MLTLKQNGNLTPYEQAWHAALKARMNVLYYERLLEKTQRSDRLLRLASTILASGGVIAAIEWLDNPAVAIAAGVVAATLNAYTLVFNLPQRANAAASLLPQYVDSYQKLKRIFMKGREIDNAELEAAIDGLDVLAVVEAKEVRTHDAKLVDDAHKRVLDELGAE